MTNMIEKREYSVPEIEKIVLDNEISLQLESTPPEGPNESIYGVNNSIDNNPYMLTDC